MSKYENLMTIHPVETSPPTETPSKVIHRLYPSLPTGDGYDLFKVENHHTAAESNVYKAQEVTQADSPPSSDVRLKAQILFLQEQRKQLLSINERWANEYRTMVQYYKDKIRVLKASEEHEEEIRDKGQKHIALVKKQKVQLVTEGDNSQTERSRSELLEADEETEELRLQNHTLTRRGQHQHEEIRRLNKALEEALQTSQAESVSTEETPNIWKHQAQVYKEDFFRERKDREKLKVKNMELESRFRKVYNELHILKSQVTMVVKPQPGLHCRCNAPDKSPNWEVHQVDQHYIQKQKRHTLNIKH